MFTKKVKKEGNILFKKIPF